MTTKASRPKNLPCREIAVCLATLAIISLWPLAARAQLNIITTTTTYESLATELGGSHVQVRSLMGGPQNIHNIVATPSKMVALRNADLFIHTGLDLELWVTQLLRGSRNKNVQPRQPGNINAAQGIRLLNVPQNLSRSQGDMHIFGNPHYQLDPINLILIGRTIRDTFKRADPANAADYDQQYNNFETKMKKKIAEWLKTMRPHKGAKIVVYHDVLPYFAARFGLDVIGFVEPKPGISPTARHTAELIELMRSADCRVIMVNTWANRATAQSIANQVGATLVTLPEWVGGVSGAEDCIGHIEYLVNNLASALDGGGGQ